MLKVPRDLLRHFRAVLRQSLLAVAPRGPWPVVLAQADREGLTLQASQGELALRYRQPGAAGRGTLAIPGEVLAQFEGRRADLVSLEFMGPGKGKANWADAGVPRTIEFELAKPDSVSVFPDLPRQFSPIPASLLEALAEAAHTTPRDNVRYTLTRVLLRGKAGQVVSTDCKQLLVQSGFPFPWSDDVLVPRVPAFGLKELAGEQAVVLGRTRDHVAVQAGGWTFLLLIDTTGRYPNVDQVIPRPGLPGTCLRVHPADAAFLLQTFPRLPGKKDLFAPATLDLTSQAALRVHDIERDQVTEVLLARSTVTGPPVRLCLNRRYLERLLHLHFQEVMILGPDKPLLCRDQERLYLFMPLEGNGALAPTKGMFRLASTANPAPRAKPPTERKTDPMPPVHPNSQGPQHQHPTPSEADRDGFTELLTEAEALRTLLQNATVRAGRLVAALKQQRQQGRAVRQAMRSLRRLTQLGG